MPEAQIILIRNLYADFFHCATLCFQSKRPVFKILFLKCVQTSLLFLFFINSVPFFAEAQSCSSYKKIENRIKGLTFLPSENKWDSGIDAYRKITDSILETAVQFARMANYDSAISLYQKAQRLFDEHKDYNGYIMCILRTAEFYRKKGDYVKAFGLGVQALNMTKKYSDKTEVAVLPRCYNMLGNIYYLQGKPDSAHFYFSLSVQEKTKLYGVCHPEVATSLNNLGIVCRSTGRYEESINYLEKALLLRQKIYGKEHTEIAATLNNLGVTYSDMGDYELAKEYYQQSLNMKRKILDNEHPEVLSTLNNLGVISGEQNDYETSEKYFRQVLELNLKLTNGDINTPEIALAYQNLGNIYYSRNEYVKASENLTRSYNIRVKILGLLHPETAICLRILGVCEYAQNNFKKAYHYYLQTLKILYPSFGYHHPEIAKTHRTFGELFSDSSKFCNNNHEKKAALDSAFYHIQKALGSLFSVPVPMSAYINPKLEHWEGEKLVLEILVEKGDALFKKWEILEK